MHVSDLCIAEKHGDTPLHIAADRNQAAAASFLVQNGAVSNARNHNALIPLHVAIVKGNNETLKVRRTSVVES